MAKVRGIVIVSISHLLFELKSLKQKPLKGAIPTGVLPPKNKKAAAVNLTAFYPLFN
ncbi:MAG: hypothetical protein HZB80_01685 [Deltaproteobacteria bacterium]|nr:hypothetical protein [Deltaproteobacteria bacterium]